MGGDFEVAVTPADVTGGLGHYRRDFFGRQIERPENCHVVLFWRAVRSPKSPPFDMSNGFDYDTGLERAANHDQANVVDHGFAFADMAAEKPNQFADRTWSASQEN